MLILSAWGIVIPVLCDNLKFQWEDGNKEITDIKSTFLTQEIVDLKLHELAKAFDTECQRQVLLQGGESAEHELMLLQNRITVAKQSFWKVHALVARLGFKVKESFMDYLYINGA